ncbi:hypothetical protein [Nonomuraea salmonea]|uniref:hypothetical protein n=1 Tax=Nonomuraea salmonea TaxID=46181 RepID=UPI0031E9A4C2
MRTYRELLRAPEFAPLFAATAAHVAASTVSGLALGVLVYGATRSPLLAALSMFGPSLAQVIGAAALLSAADRLPPRAALSGIALVFGVGTAVLAVPGLPVGGAVRGRAGARAGRVAERRRAVGAAQRDPAARGLPAGPLDDEHDRRSPADLRLRGRRRAGGRPVAARRAAGRGRAVPGGGGRRPVGGSVPGRHGARAVRR